jgi:oligopeptide transport system permease protein
MTTATLVNADPRALNIERSEGVWHAAWVRFKTNRVGMGALVVVALFFVLILAAAFGWVAKDWQREVGVPDTNPTFLGKTVQEDKMVVEQAKGPVVDISSVDPLAPRYKEWAERASKIQIADPPRSDTLPLGGDRLGRDVLAKVIKGAQVSVLVGVLAALVATLIGTTLGAISGFFGGRIGDFLEWLYNVFTSIPGILLIFTFAAVLNHPASIIPKGVWTVVIILGLTGWPSLYRLIRAEYMKHRAREYVRAAESIGVSNTSRIFRHILPNVSHVVLVQLSILVVAFIKAEVILSYLGLGVPLDAVSWGTMLAESQSDLLRGKWWQLAAATAFMAVFVTAFALLTDALRDALDPKLRGLEK